MKVAKIEKNSISNGPGVRVVVWCQGCSIRCSECHNKGTWDPEGGEYITHLDVITIFEELEKPWVRGITFSGGHPLEDYNLEGVIELASNIREKFPEKDIWLYTGLKLYYNDFQQDSSLFTCLKLCDVVVDGPYVHELRDIRLPYSGSSNQRVIDVKKTLKNKEITLYKE